MKRITSIPSVLALALAPSLASAATLAAVPMQGGMVMTMVSYQASDGALHVMMPQEIPQLTPLLASNPGDQFDPGDPWFNALDPSNQGASFSRSHGFAMDPMSDPLPAGTRMWIRKLYGPPELKFYRYSASAPKAFTPIFGTEGATNGISWNGIMFHPVVCAAPGTNHYAATFEVCLVDASTGRELPNSKSGPVEFDWTDSPDGRPDLSVAQRIVVAWPSGTTANWVVESSSSLTSSNWTVVTNAPIDLDGQPSLVLTSGTAQKYFRMRYVP